MNITATKNALNFLELHPEFHFPRTASECFGGLVTLDGKNTPDLTVGIAHLNKRLTLIKDELKAKIDKISLKSSTLIPSNMSAYYIIENADITLITKKDSEDSTSIPVRNLFKYQITQNNEVSYEVVTCPKTPDDDPKDDLLGVYLLETGSIMLWIDRISSKDRSELVFQKVLLHEMIHAFLDIFPRVYLKYPNGMCFILTTIGNKDTTESEETIDNIMVLDCYSHCGEVDYNFIKNFISNQPDKYKAAIGKHNHQKGDYSVIKDHLEDKLSKNENLDISKSVSYYMVSLDDDEDNEDNYLVALYKQGLTEIKSSLPAFKEYHKDNDDIYCTRFLLKDSWLDLRNPWIIYRLNLLTKEITLRIGDILYYQFNPIDEYEKCMDLLNHKKIYEDKGLDFEIARYTSNLIWTLISSINPECYTFCENNFIPDSQRLGE